MRWSVLVLFRSSKGSCFLHSGSVSSTKLLLLLLLLEDEDEISKALLSKEEEEDVPACSTDWAIEGGTTV